MFDLMPIPHSHFMLFLFLINSFLQLCCDANSPHFDSSISKATVRLNSTLHFCFRYFLFLQLFQFDPESLISPFYEKLTLEILLPEVSFTFRYVIKSVCCKHKIIYAYIPSTLCYKFYTDLFNCKWFMCILYRIIFIQDDAMYLQTQRCT